MKLSKTKTRVENLKRLLLLLVISFVGIQAQAQKMCATLEQNGCSQSRNGYPVPGLYKEIGQKNGAPHLRLGIFDIFFTGTEWQVYDTMFETVFYKNPSTALTIPTTGWVDSGTGDAGCGMKPLTVYECPVPKVDVVGNSLTIASGSTAPTVANNTDFGSVNVAEIQNQEFVIQNNGNSTLTISSFTITGTHASDFSVISPASFTPISASASTNMTIQFAPTSGGIRSATVVINSDDSDNPTYWYAIQGTGVCTSYNPIVISQAGSLCAGGGSVTLTATSVDATSFTAIGPDDYESVNGTGVFTLTQPGDYTISSDGTCAQSIVKSVPAGGLPVINIPTIIGVLGPDNCTINLKVNATGKSFAFNGPNGYVFSNVYRREGSYAVSSNGITQPGIYSITARTGEGCTPITTTFEVTGTACK